MTIHTSSEKAADIAFRALARAAVASGRISPESLDRVGFAQAFLKWLEEVPPEAIKVTIDHRPGLLREARRLERSGFLELALLLYATWAEHFINAIVRTLGEKRSLPPKTLASMLRDVPLRGKARWLIQILGGPEISEKHVRRIESLSERRNSYVHYKWNHIDDIPIESAKGPLKRKRSAWTC